jgi:hypothetical protein
MATRLPSHKTLSTALASIANTIDDAEVRDAFAYVADFLHQQDCNGDETCGLIAEAFQPKTTKVGKALQPKLVGSKRQRPVTILRRTK